MKSPQQLSQEIIDIIKATGNYFVGNTSGMSNDGTVNVYHPKGYSISAIAANPISSGEVIVFNVNGVWYAFGEQRTVIKQDILIQRKSRAIVSDDYPVITLFGKVIIADNNQILSIGGNQPKKQIKINNQLITVPFGEDDNSSETYTICNGYIVNLNKKEYAAFFDWNYGYPFYHPDNPNVTYISIINNIKTEIVAGRFASYLGYGLWTNESSLVIRNGVLTDYSASNSIVENEINPLLTYNDYIITRNTWEGVFTFKRQVIDYEVSIQNVLLSESYKDNLNGYAPVLNFEKHYIKQSISCERESYRSPGTQFVDFITRFPAFTELSNSFSIVNKETSATQPLNSDDFLIARFQEIENSFGGSVTYPTSKNPGTTFGFTVIVSSSFNSGYLNNLPVMSVFYIDDGFYFIKANITNVSNTTVSSTYVEQVIVNGLPKIAFRRVLTVIMTIVSHSKKLKSLPSFDQATVVSDNGSFHCFYLTMGLKSPLFTFGNYFLTKQTMKPIAYTPLTFFVDGDLAESFATLGGGVFNPRYLHYLPSNFLKNLNFVNNRFYNVINFGKSVEIWKLETNGDIKFEKIIDNIEYYDAKGLNRRETGVSYPRFYSYSYYPI